MSYYTTTALRILNANAQETYSQCTKLEAEARELATEVVYPAKLSEREVFEVVYRFYDGSALIKNRDGFKAV